MSVTSPKRSIGTGCTGNLACHSAVFAIVSGIIFRPTFMPIALLQCAYWSVRYSPPRTCLSARHATRGCFGFSFVRHLSVACVRTLLTAVPGGRAGRWRPVVGGADGGPPAINFQTWSMRVHPDGTASINPACKEQTDR